MQAFRDSGLTEIALPDSVADLGDKCFFRLLESERVTIPASSSLKRIGIGPFCYAAVEEIHFPDRLKGVMMDAVPSNAIATG